MPSIALFVKTTIVIASCCFILSQRTSLLESINHTDRTSITPSETTHIYQQEETYSNTPISLSYLPKASSTNTVIHRNLADHDYDLTCSETEWQTPFRDLNNAPFNSTLYSSIALSGDGRTMAVYAPSNSMLENGYVRIYRHKPKSKKGWKQIGSDIDNTGFGENWASVRIALNFDGSIFAMGEPFVSTDNLELDKKGRVKVFQLVTSSSTKDWSQMGEDITGQNDKDYFGWSVSLSNNGHILAASSKLNDGEGDAAGHVQIHEFQDGSWKQVGESIDGESADDHSGRSIDLSGDGRFIVIGSPRNDGDGISKDVGHVRVYERDPNAPLGWKMLGESHGETENAKDGFSVSISNDATTIAVSSRPSTVKIYEVNSSSISLKHEFDVDASIDASIHSVSLSGDGQRLAVSSVNLMKDCIGHVTMYQLDGSTAQIGQTISGFEDGDNVGATIVLSYDGDMLLMAGKQGSGNIGHIRTYVLCSVFIPSATPSLELSHRPSIIPTMNPTTIPTGNPSLVPSIESSTSPSFHPTLIPTVIPSFEPSASLKPSMSPTEFYLDFDGIRGMYSNNEGQVLILFDPPYNIDEASYNDVVYDVLIAPTGFDIDTALDNIAASIPKWIELFETDESLEHRRFTNVNGVGNCNITVGSLNHGEHVMLMTATLDTDYSTNTVFRQIQVSSSDPVLKNDKNIVGIFVPTDNINITITEEEEGVHQLIFKGGPFPETTKNLKVGDIVNGFDSISFDSFMVKVETVKTSNDSIIVLGVSDVALEDMYDAFHLSSNFAANQRRRLHHKDDGNIGAERKLHEVEEITSSFVNMGDGLSFEVIGDRIETVSDISKYLAEKAHNLGIHEEYELPSSQVSLIDEEEGTHAKASGTLLFDTRIIVDIHHEEGSFTASMTSATEYRVASSYDDEGEGSTETCMRRRRLEHNTAHEDATSDPSLDCDKKKVKNQIVTYHTCTQIPTCSMTLPLRWSECYDLYLSLLDEECDEPDTTSTDDDDATSDDAISDDATSTDETNDDGEGDEEVCEDVDTFQFVLEGTSKVKGCDWITKKKARVAQVCDDTYEGNVISDQCPKACGICSNPTQTPTSSPSSSSSFVCEDPAGTVRIVMDNGKARKKSCNKFKKGGFCSDSQVLRTCPISCEHSCVSRSHSMAGRELSGDVAAVNVDLSFSGSSGVRVELSNNALSQTLVEPTFIKEKSSIDVIGDIEVNTSILIERHFNFDVFGGLLESSSSNSFEEFIVVEVDEGANETEYDVNLNLGKYAVGSAIINGTKEVSEPENVLIEEHVDDSIETLQPSLAPSNSPTLVASNSPTLVPSIVPSARPSSIPSLIPTSIPTMQPSLEPSLTSSMNPSEMPTKAPSIEPSALPTFQPSTSPSIPPTTTPSSHPSSYPTSQPSIEPFATPSDIPTSSPTCSDNPDFKFLPKPGMQRKKCEWVRKKPARVVAHCHDKVLENCRRSCGVC